VYEPESNSGDEDAVSSGDVVGSGDIMGSGGEI